MAQTNRSRFVLVAACLSLTCWTAGRAQNNRSAVSLTGNDAASCAVADPCRSFGAAIAKTNDGGEVVALSSAGYGPFTVTKSVSIISPGGIHAALTATTGSAITIDATFIRVFLRNLWINNLGGSNGINILNAEQVHVENCTIAGFTTGINAPLTNGVTDFWMSVVDSFLRINQGGISLSAGPNASAVSRLTVDRSHLENNGGTAIFINPVANTTVDSVIRESVITSNLNGIRVALTGSSSTNIEGCVFVHNQTVALRGGGDATRAIRASQSYIANNGVGLSSAGGDDLQSFGNNRLKGNGTDGSFTSTTPLQ